MDADERGLAQIQELGSRTRRRPERRDYGAAGMRPSTSSGETKSELKPMDCQPEGLESRLFLFESFFEKKQSNNNLCKSALICVP